MTINDLFVKYNLFGEGFIFKLYEKEKFPFATIEEICSLDLDYAFNWAGKKLISPLVQYYVDTQDTTFNEVVNVISIRYYDKWKKIYDAIMAEYKPAENYNLTETSTETVSSDHSKSESTRLETNDDTLNGIFGYDSDATVGTTNQTNRTTIEGSLEDNQTKVEDNSERVYTTNRHGNIGTISSQKLIQQELELRRFEFFKQVFKDLDNVLTMKVYEL